MNRERLALASWGALILACVALCSGCADWSKEAVAESQHRGDKIIAALEAYKVAHGVYPKALDKLVPQYSPRIQPPTAGSEAWSYGVYKGGSVFNLWFEGPSKYDPWCGYSSASEDWAFISK